MNVTTQCGENRPIDVASFAKLIHTKKLINCVAIFTILYGNYYPPHGESFDVRSTRGLLACRLQ